MIEQIPPISIQLRVRWASMMAAKLANALRPLRLLRFVLACLATGVGLAVIAETSFVLMTTAVLAASTMLRLIVMAVSSAFSTDASKRFDGLFSFSEEGIEQERLDGSKLHYAWSWVLDAQELRRVFVLRVGGGNFVFLSHVGLGTQVDRLRALLGSKGKL